MGNAVAANAGQVFLIPSASNAAVGSLDTTAATALSFSAQFSVNSNRLVPPAGFFVRAISDCPP